MGPEGHYCYLIAFAKAHAVLGDETIVTPDGRKCMAFCNHTVIPVPEKWIKMSNSLDWTFALIDI